MVLLPLFWNVLLLKLLDIQGIFTKDQGDSALKSGLHDFFPERSSHHLPAQYKVYKLIKNIFDNYTGKSDLERYHIPHALAMETG